MRRPQTPEIFVGLRDRPCSLAILMDTGSKDCIKEEQQNSLPHLPMPPQCLDRFRIPTWRISILMLYSLTKSLINSLKSIRPSAV